MNNFDNDQFGTKQESTPGSFENKSHTILKFPKMEIDLAQPSRTEQDIVDETVGMEGAKQVAEIRTPTGAADIFYIKELDYDPVVLIIDTKDRTKRDAIGLDETIDLSGDEGKCIITFDEYGRLLVHAEDVDTSYQIFAREIGYEVPETTSDFSDDPES
jgi:hypothetical protein